LRVEIVGHGRDGALVEVELSSRVAAGGQEELRAPQRCVALVGVELDLCAGREAERGEAIELRRSFQCPECFADRVPAGYDAARTAATT
jgi:hypothetical protein